MSIFLVAGRDEVVVEVFFKNADVFGIEVVNPVAVHPIAIVVEGIGISLGASAAQHMEAILFDDGLKSIFGDVEFANVVEDRTKSIDVIDEQLAIAEEWRVGLNPRELKFAEALAVVENGMHEGFVEAMAIEA